jgi:LPXTG-motif cell wall-anchored protein
MYLLGESSGGFWDAVGSAGRAILPTLTSAGGQILAGKEVAKVQAEADKKAQRTQLLAQAAQRKAEKKAERFAIAQQTQQTRGGSVAIIAGGVGVVALAGGAWWYLSKRKKKKAKT